MCLKCAPYSVPPHTPFHPSLPSAPGPYRDSLPSPRAPYSLPPQPPFRPRLPSAPSSESLPPQARFRPKLASAPGSLQLQVTSAPACRPSAPACQPCLPPQPAFRPSLPSAAGSLPPQPPFCPSLPSASGRPWMVFTGRCMGRCRVRRLLRGIVHSGYKTGVPAPRLIGEFASPQGRQRLPRSGILNAKSRKLERLSDNQVPEYSEEYYGFLQQREAFQAQDVTD